MSAVELGDPWAEADRPQIRLDEVVAIQASKRPDHLAVVAGDDRRTYAQLESDIEALAADLRSAGIGRGDRVVTSVSAGLGSVVILYAISRARAVAVPVNEFWTSTEVTSAIHRSGAAHIVTDARLGGVGSEVHAALAQFTPQQRPRHGILGRASAIEWQAAGRRPQPAPLNDDLAMLLFTSGSTSQPKGAFLTHVGLVGAAHYVRVACAMDGDTRFLQLLPAYHVGGVVDGFVGVHLAGGTCVVERFHPSAVLKLLAEHSITHLSAFEAMIDALMSSPDYDSALHPHWQTVFLAGSERGYDRLRAAGVSHVVSGFGMTETSCDFLITRSTQDEAEIRASHWLPNPGVDVRVVDPHTGKPVPAGEIGEIRVRGWNVFPEYLDGTTGRDDDDYFCTGDLGRQTTAGAFRYAGRLKEMIKSGGENVAAAEVEEFLTAEVVGLRTAVVVGVPDERWGERVVAFLELEAGSEITLDDVRHLCRGKLAPFKIPKQVILVPSGGWPLMAAGKISRPQLRVMAAGGQPG